MTYIEQFFLIAVVHFLAVASPGPDFAIILNKVFVMIDAQQFSLVLVLPLAFYYT